MLIDFSKWEEYPFRSYDGANGAKKCLRHDQQLFMVKIMNGTTHPMGAISEYLGCHIYELLRIPVQKTYLGKYSSHGKEYLAVACQDFCEQGDRLNEFSTIRNAIVESSQSGHNKALLPILLSIDEQWFVPAQELKERFWDMFVVDALIGNFDRHTGNFGIIANEVKQTNRIAPVYDCGSALYPAPTDEQISAILSSDDALLERVYEFPASTYRSPQGKKYFYHELLSSNAFSDCSDALRRLKPRIDDAMSDIHALVSDLDSSIVSDTRKRFYHMMLDLRKERIIDFSYKEIQSRTPQSFSDQEEEIHQREEFLKLEHPNLDGIEADYVHLYQHVVATIENQTALHIRSSEIDAAVVAELRRKQKYSIDAIRQTVSAYSPLALQYDDYAGKILILAKEPRFQRFFAKANQDTR